MRGMAREYAAGNSLGPGWHESAGIFGCPVGGSVADLPTPNGTQAISPVAPSPPFRFPHAVHLWIRAKACGPG